MPFNLLNILNRSHNFCSLCIFKSVLRNSAYLAGFCVHLFQILRLRYCYQANRAQVHCLESHLLSCTISLNRSRVSSSSIVSDYGLDDRAIGVRFPAKAKDFSCSLCVQTGSGAHPASCPIGTGGPFLGGKSTAGS
jgi:hypothetical protein